MNAAKQTAMDHYGLTTWPPSHQRTPKALVDCRGMACEIMRRDGMSLESVALEVGFADHKSVRDALFRRLRNRLKGMGHLDALVYCFEMMEV